MQNNTESLSTLRHVDITANGFFFFFTDQTTVKTIPGLAHYTIYNHLHGLFAALYNNDLLLDNIDYIALGYALAAYNYKNDYKRLHRVNIPGDKFNLFISIVNRYNDSLTATVNDDSITLTLIPLAI